MSKENAIRFMMIMNQDEELKADFSNIISKYKGKKLSKAGWDTVLKKEVIPFAKEHGYDFSLEELELKKTAVETISDEELNHVVGGFGEWYNNGIFYCTYAPDDQTFLTRILAGNNNGCPDFTANEDMFGGYDHSMSCASCANLKRH